MTGNGWTHPETVKALRGKKVSAVRAATKEEQDVFGVGDFPVIEMEDGYVVAVLCDPEGNGPGSLHLVGKLG